MDLLFPDDSLLPLDDSDQETLAPEQEAELLEEKIINENIDAPIKLDYKLTTCAERSDLVNKIVERTPKDKLTPKYLEILGDYIMGGITKEEKKEKLYLTDNRMVTVNKRETSFEGLAEKFENGEDGIYNLITENKNIIFAPKVEITEDDIATIPGLKELREAIAQVEEACKAATGKNKFLLKKQLIEMRRDQYIIKSGYRGAPQPIISAHGPNKIDLSETQYIDAEGNPQSTGLVTLFKADHVAAILQNYNALKIATRGRYQNDFFYLMEDFDQVFNEALNDHPQYLDIVKYKWDNKTAIEIQQMLLDKYGISHSIQYISSLWCNKIPQLIADKAQTDFLMWYYETQEKGPMKRCACCGQKKPANGRFFSKNKTAKDGWYSWCKACRNKKTAENKKKN